jgi:putative PEP-CTERM system histidine kinase
MSVRALVELFSSVAGLTGAILVFVFRKFGPASWLLALFLAAGALTSGVLLLGVQAGLQDDADISRIAFASLLLCAPLGLFFTWTVDRADYRQALGERRRVLLLIIIALPLTLASIFFLRPALSEEQIMPMGFTALGPGGYFSALYIIVVSVLALAGLEQIVRSADERVRWEIKFLVLGMGGAYGAMIYIASKVLLYSFRYALLPRETLNVFSTVFVLSCALILVSWRRTSAGSRIAVSQSFIYSSITLLCVGIYLIVSSLVARWASQWGEPGIQTEAIVFMLSVMALASVLFWTSFRHRARLWLHRHIFSGKYDYRRYWMETAEKVRSVDDLDAAALALARIIQSALGSIDVSVWLRTRNPDGLKLLAALGTKFNAENRDAQSIVERVIDLESPVSQQEVASLDGAKDLQAFMQRINSVLLVPLVSSGRTVGLVAVGSDRSGQSFDWEAREFLRILASHAASELHKSELLATLISAKEAEAFRSFSTFLLHDLKNFASTLSLIAKNADRHRENPEFQRDAFQSVLDTSEKMKRLCNSLRTFSGSLAANKKTVDLNEIVHSVADKLNAGVASHLRLELGELPNIMADWEEIERVVQNLLLNAREAISPQGTIIVRTRGLDDTIELSVKDDGRGMTRAFLQKELFLPFHTTKSDGLGIGLFQCRKIVEAHSGSIHVDSEEGKGTAVRVILPILTAVTQ